MIDNEYSKPCKIERFHISLPSWKLQVLDAQCEAFSTNRSQFLSSAIPQRIATLYNLSVKERTLRKLFGGPTSPQKIKIEFRCPADLANAFQTHCRQWGCDRDALYTLGAALNILNSRFPADIMDLEYRSMMDGDNEFRGVKG